MSPTRACCLAAIVVVAAATAAACDGVEQRSGAVVEPSFGDGSGLLWELPNAVVFEVDLGRGVKNNDVIRASAPPDEISCASGTEFTSELVSVGTAVEFDIDTGQDFDTSDPPAFTVTNLVVDC